MTDTSPQVEDFAPGRPIVFRNGIVITVDSPDVILGGDVLITGDTNPDQIRTIAASGLEVLHKPLREEELHEAICALLASPQPVSL